MHLSTVVWIYAVGWFLYAAHFLIKMYRSGEMKGMETNILKKVADDPEAAAHYENNVHGIRTKTRILLPALPIALAFMFGSVWPLVLAVRVTMEISELLRRNRDD